jgi:outer membrane biosynthesis protein TonB
MRLAIFSRSLLLLALPAILVTCAAAQDHPNVQPSSIRDQLSNPPAKSQSAPAATKAPAPAQEPKVPAKAPSKAPSKVKPPAKAAAARAPAKAPTPAKAPAAAKAPAKAPAKTAEKKPAKAPVEKPAEEKVSATKRDPFEALLNKPSQGTGAPVNLPPGKAGLVVGTLRVDGIVGGVKGMIAIVSNPQQRVYFLREGDKLYDGSVQHITIEAVSFQEVGKDAFGKPLERQVTKRLYPSPGEQQ